MNNCYVYLHKRLDTNEIFYIGIGTKGKDRKSYDRAFNKTKRNNYWKNIVNKVEYKVEIILDNINLQEACNKEIELIKCYGRKDLGTGILCNLTNGGETNSNRIVSEITRKKLSIINTGKKHSEETKSKLKLIAQNLSPEIRKKQGESRTGIKHFNYGKHLSEETKKRISQGNKGKFLTENHKNKLRKAHTGKKVSKETIEKMKIAKIGNSSYFNEKEIKTICDYLMLNYSYKQLKFLFSKLNSKILSDIRNKKVWKDITKLYNFPKANMKHSQETKEKIRLSLKTKFNEIAILQKMEEAHKLFTETGNIPEFKDELYSEDLY